MLHEKEDYLDIRYNYGAVFSRLTLSSGKLHRRDGEDAQPVQFDAAVKRSLFQVPKDVEYNEAQRWLIEDTSDAERKALQSSQQGANMVQQTQSYVVKSPDGSVSSELDFKTIPSNSATLPKAMIMRRHGLNTIPQTSQSLIEAIRNRYMYQRYLLDEVAWQMIYHSMDKAIGERIRYKDIDNYLKLDLLNRYRPTLSLFYYRQER